MEDNSILNKDEENILSGNTSSNQGVSGERGIDNHNELTFEQNNNPATNIANEVDEDIKALENGPQKHPGSSGAFPVGAFDTSKPD